jgi:hypothetical protein
VYSETQYSASSLNSLPPEIFMEIILKELKLWLSEEGNQLKTRCGLTTEY